MIIRKLFEFNGSHIVRNCSSDRCKRSIHAHKYTVEVFFVASTVDNGYMLMDFGLMKGTIKDFIKGFNEAYSLWDKESDDFKDAINSEYQRVVTMPVSPSAEMYSLVLLKAIDAIVKNTKFNNGESIDLTVQSVSVHETTTGYAISSQDDLTNTQMPVIDLAEIKFNTAIKESWKDPKMWDKVLSGIKFSNPVVKQQIKG